MTDSPSQQATSKGHRNRWMILIAAFKLGQALLFAAVGVGAVRLLHKHVGDVLQHLADHLRFSPESHFIGVINYILAKSSLVNDHMLRRISAVGFIYAALDLIEGTGLYLEKTWAEYLTLIITASFLPLEGYEVFYRVTPIRVSLLVINALVFFYLLKMVVERAKRPKRTVSSS
jgi:uncharacterized membrane protein (DUF2068 family)